MQNIADPLSGAIHAQSTITAKFVVYVYKFST